MSRCPGCGTELTTGGCINADCGMGVGGVYVADRDGTLRKTHTASGRPLVPIDIPSIMRAGGFDEGVAAERARTIAWLYSEDARRYTEVGPLVAKALEEGRHLTKHGA